MKNKLAGKNVAVLATDGVDQAEFEEPIAALKDAGAKVTVISLKKDTIKAWSKKDWGDKFDADLHIDEANSKSYDALVLPGGVMNPDKLRMNENAVRFAGDFLDAGKPVAAICHGPWTLIETGKIRGRKMTSYPSIKTDLINAGAQWVDEEVVADRGLVTSRSPKDLPAFCKKMIEEIQEGIHEANPIGDFPRI